MRPTFCEDCGAEGLPVPPCRRRSGMRYCTANYRVCCASMVSAVVPHKDNCAQNIDAFCLEEEDAHVIPQPAGSRWLQ